jgi:hypothetical protein
MSPPLAVITSTLRGEADVWSAQSGVLGGLTTKAEGLELTRLEAGVFQLFVGAYNDAAGQVTARCGEGKQRMNEIAAALRQVADRYDKSEKEAEALFKNLF